MPERLSAVQPYIITGASGAGKSTVAKGLEAITDGPYKFERAKAVVTRAQRDPDDDDQIFVSDTQYDKLKSAGRFVLETPSYNYRGAVVPYVQSESHTYPLYILTPFNAQRLQALFSPTPRIVHVDRLGTSAVQALHSERPSMTQEDIDERLKRGAGDRITAREVENIGINNDGDLSSTVTKLYEMLVADIERSQV